MPDIKCPKCESEVELFIGPLRPMEAVAADLLEKGIILRCLKCHLWAPVSAAKCPSCGKFTLTHQLEPPIETDPLTTPRKGKIVCSACTYTLSVS